MRAIASLFLLVFAAAAIAEQPPAKPGPEHEKLGYFVGKWKTEGTMSESPMGPAGKITSNDDCQWYEGKFTVVCHGSGSSPLGPTKSLGILGYSMDEKVYTYYGIDNTAMSMMSIPRGRVSGDTWTYTDVGTMGGRPYQSRVTLKQLAKDAYTFKMEMADDKGRWTTLMESKSTRQ